MIMNFRRFLRREEGVATVELALVTPVFLLMFLSIIELGHMIYYSINLEKGLRSAATYVGRNEILTPEVELAVVNIAKTGNPNGGTFLVPGWADPLATVDVVKSNFVSTGGKTGDDVNIVVYKITISVPYVAVVGVLVPALEYLYRSQNFKQGKYMITLAQDQAMIGN